MDHHTHPLHATQFSLRTLLLAVGVLNLLVAFPQFVMSLPLPLVIALLLLTLTSALIAVLLLFVLCVLTVSVWRSSETWESKRTYLRRCAGLLVLALLAVAPVVSLAIYAGVRRANQPPAPRPPAVSISRGAPVAARNHGHLRHPREVAPSMPSQ